MSNLKYTTNFAIKRPEYLYYLITLPAWSSSAAGLETFIAVASGTDIATESASFGRSVEKTTEFAVKTSWEVNSGSGSLGEI